MFDDEPDEERALSKESWAKERKRRADISLYGLPPFVPPTYAELRKLYRLYRDPDVRRLLLEIQCGRYAFSESAALAGECYWDVTNENASLEEARKAFARLRHRPLVKVPTTARINSFRLVVSTR